MPYKSAKDKQEYNRQYYLKHRDQFLEHSRRYYTEHKDEIKVKFRVYGQGYNKKRNVLYRHLKYRAKNRGIEFNLSYAKFCEVKLMPCVFAEVTDEPCGNIRSKKEEINITIDRLTNGVYRDDDVIPVCERHNQMKNAISPEMVKKLYEIYKERGIL
jgi:hypothetical protein